MPAALSSPGRMQICLLNFPAGASPRHFHAEGRSVSSRAVFLAAGPAGGPAVHCLNTVAPLRNAPLVILSKPLQDRWLRFSPITRRTAPHLHHTCASLTVNPTEP